LWWAATNGEVSACKALLQAGANPYHAPATQPADTPAAVALSSKNEEMVVLFRSFLARKAAQRALSPAATAACRPLPGVMP
jgi:ankyrin repeat protein